ncbi:MAG TPA: ferrous iron transport protein B [Polyangiaceae bacterium]|nr:ferrous iron transport protein B [Polyangiaceae bacterium]
MNAAETLAPPSADRLPGERPVVLLVGNPNVGKTSLFNRLTGQKARVGNYPGITVERRSGSVTLPGDDGADIELIDVPGTYSLCARSAEEQIALNAALGLAGHPSPTLIVLVVDAGQLTRNLYLALQLVELRVPIVIALNMMDEVEDNPPIPEAVSKLFGGVPVVVTNARQGEGIGELKHAVRRALARPPVGSVEVRYPPSLRRVVDEVADALPAEMKGSVERQRALGLWALTSLDDEDELQVSGDLRERCRRAHAEAPGRDLDREIITARYAFLDAAAADLYRRVEAHPHKHKLSERMDRLLLHPVLGFVAFLALMLLVFQSLFTWADPAIGAIEAGVGWLQALVLDTFPDGILRDLVSEGIIGGVGNVVVFLPQILLLFFFIGLLEDSGYMARVAYLMDRIMRSLGLHGRAFVPMLSGFACAVPAILATRTMERQRDRLLTMLVIPLMTCSARLPVYTLVIAALFPPMALFGWVPVQGLLMVGMYVFSVCITLIAAAVLGRTAVRGRRVALILELPPYRLPSLGAILKLMWERSAVFLREAGTVILVCTIALWALLSFPRTPPAVEAAVGAPVAAETAAAPQSPAIENSFGGRLGKALEPAIAPLGFDWKIGVGLIGAFAAREVFVSTMGLVYGIGDAEEAVEPLREKIRREARADGQPAYRPLTGLSLLVFFALACQCMSTLAVVHRETKTWRWPAFVFAYMTGLAYVMSLAVFQVGSLLGY